MSTISTGFKECQSLFEPTTYVARGLPSFDRVKILNTTIGGNTSLTALSRLASQVKGHDFNAMVAFADVEKTAELLVNAVKNALLAYDALKRRNFKDFERRINLAFQGGSSGARLAREMKRGDIASIWLAAQYGWKPLISDVLDAYDAFVVLRKSSREFKYKGSAKSEPYDVSLDANGLSSGPIVKCTDKVTYRLWLKESLTTAQSLGLTPAGFSSVVWERIPFSFVVDWFIPIGQSLEMYAFFGSVGGSLTKTSFRYYSGRSEPLYVDGVPHSPNWTTGSANSTGASMKREAGTTADWYSLAPNFKSWARSLTSTHLLNAAALFWTMLEGHGASSGRVRSIKGSF
jgi:hypothetical protein